MNSNSCYPVVRCYFCNHIMVYARYENGGHYAYCNNSAESSCMGFVFDKKDNAVKIKEFTIGGPDIIYFRVTDAGSALLLAQPDGAPQRFEDLLDADLNTILDKDSTLKLLKKINKTIMLME